MSQGGHMFLEPPDGQGVYEECRLSDSNCINRLKQIADEGFKLVLNYNALLGSNPQQLLAYADLAQAVGMKIIWPMHVPWFWDGTDLATSYPEYAAFFTCSDNTSFINYLIALLRDHPATWGYYVGDELHPSVHQRWKAYTDLVHTIDLVHPRLLVQGTPARSLGNTTLSTFADGVEVLGQDYYPIGVSYLVPFSQTGAVAQSVQTLADRTGKEAAMVLQAFSWTQYYPQARCSSYPDCAPYPSVEEMQQMLSMVLENSHPRLILWYSFFDILRSDNPTAHWNDLVKVMRSISSS
jgi:hypothetical protein